MWTTREVYPCDITKVSHGHWKSRNLTFVFLPSGKPCEQPWRRNGTLNSTIVPFLTEGKLLKSNCHRTLNTAQTAIRMVIFSVTQLQLWCPCDCANWYYGPTALSCSLGCWLAFRKRGVVFKFDFAFVNRNLLLISQKCTSYIFTKENTDISCLYLETPVLHLFKM